MVNVIVIVVDRRNFILVELLAFLNDDYLEAGQPDFANNKT